MRYSLLALALASVALALVMQNGVRAEIAGSRGRPSTYQGMILLGNGSQCRLAIDIERVGFLLTAVANKYRFARMLVDCQKQEGLMLSATTDRLDIIVGDRSVQGILSLQRAAAAIWDGLDVEMRQTLAYPSAIRPGEPVYLFVYFSADQVTAMPDEFVYTIASLGQRVRLRVLATAA